MSKVNVPLTGLQLEALIDVVAWYRNRESVDNGIARPLPTGSEPLKDAEATLRSVLSSYSHGSHPIDGGRRPAMTSEPRCVAAMANGDGVCGWVRDHRGGHSWEERPDSLVHVVRADAAQFVRPDPGWSGTLQAERDPLAVSADELMVVIAVMSRGALAALRTITTPVPGTPISDGVKALRQADASPLDLSTPRQSKDQGHPPESYRLQQIGNPPRGVDSPPSGPPGTPEPPASPASTSGGRLPSEVVSTGAVVELTLRVVPGSSEMASTRVANSKIYVHDANGERLGKLTGVQKLTRELDAHTRQDTTTLKISARGATWA
jgi:hypothetical protein